MLLTPPQILELCEKPAHLNDIQAGRAAEAVHQLHVDGETHRILTFLKEQRIALTSDEAQLVLEKVKEAGTMPIYDSLTNVLSKAINAPGTNYYFEFSDPALNDDFEAYLKDKRLTGQDFYQSFNRAQFKQSQTGFQGVFLVDLPVLTDANAAELLQDRPRPFFRYVDSGGVHDVGVTGNRIEYLILWQQTAADVKDFWVWDDAYCYRVRFADGAYTRLTAEDFHHELGFVPARFPTSITPDQRRPWLRSSFLAKSLPLANVYLRDFCNHELGKARFVHPKPWSYGVKCDNEVAAHGDLPWAHCANGWLVYPNHKVVCPVCQGKGRYIPYSRDQGYIVDPPGVGEEKITPPAGYVVPDLESLKYLGEELKANEAKIEKAVLGKEGILTMQSKQETALGKTLDLGPMEARLALVADDWIDCQKFLLDAYATYRYREQYRGSSCNAGRRWTLAGASVLEAEYAAAKKAGMDPAGLYPYLENIIYAKYANDPMELQRNLLKLQLAPAPTTTVAEARENGILSARRLLLKENLNDFIIRFEEENGSILDFGSALPQAEKLKRIRETLNTYVDEEREDLGEFPLSELGAATAAVGSESGAALAATATI